MVTSKKKFEEKVTSLYLSDLNLLYESSYNIFHDAISGHIHLHISFFDYFFPIRWISKLLE